MKTWKDTIAAIEEEIAETIENLEKDYDLGDYDIQEIREEVYQSYGFDGDPYAEEEDEADWTGSEMSHKLAEVGMSERDFF